MTGLAAAVRFGTIQKAWETYAADIIPTEAPAVQRQESRRAFYAGAYAVLVLSFRIGEADVSEDAGVAMVRGLHEECHGFAAAVLRGEA